MANLSDLTIKYEYDTVAMLHLSDYIFRSATLSNNFSSISAAYQSVKETYADAMKNALKNVEILRPEDEHSLHLRVNVFKTPGMSSTADDQKLSAVLDTENEDCWRYFQALLVNGVEDISLTGSSSAELTSFIGTQWISPEQLDKASTDYGGSGFTGFGPAFNNAPVDIMFADWLNHISVDYDIGSRFYLKYEWYYKDGAGIEHTSDKFSMVVPSYAEVGAKAGGTASKADVVDIKQSIETDVTTAKHMDTNDISEMDGKTDAGVADYTATGYYACPFQCTVLSAFGECDDKKVILQDYSEGKTYKLKFKTGIEDVKTGSFPSSSVMQFCANYGSGAEAIEELNEAGLTFSAGKMYLIAVNLGMIQVIASK